MVREHFEGLDRGRKVPSGPAIGLAGIGQFPSGRRDRQAQVDGFCIARCQIEIVLVLFDTETGIGTGFRSEQQSVCNCFDI